MLGEQIGEEKGRVIVRRVLEVDGQPKLEVSVQSDGKLLGIDVRTMVTYWAILRSDGSLYGEGQGLVQGKNGEIATYKGQGAGRLLGGGAVSYRGSLFFNSQNEKLARLNNIAAVFEYDVDAEGNTRTKTWEWR